jgi:hypothetical protein
MVSCQDCWRSSGHTFECGQTVFSFSHIEGITMGAGEKEYEVAAAGVSGMGVDRIGKVGDRANEGQAAGVYGAGFTAGSLTRK